MSLVTISSLPQAAGVKLSARTSASRRFCGPHTPRESGSQERHEGVSETSGLSPALLRSCV